MMTTPPAHILRNICWSFAEPVPGSPEALVVGVREYAADIQVLDASAELLLTLPLSDLVVRYAIACRCETGEWGTVVKEHRVVAPLPGRLTGAALLWELHVVCHESAGRQDSHYFEGLELVSHTPDGSPVVYELVLGS